MQVVNPPVVSPTQPYLLAAARDVNANSLATTSLSWQSTNSAANTLPLYAKVVRKTGTLTLLVASVRLNATIVQAITAVQAALLGSGTDSLLYPLSSAVAVAVVPLSGSWDVVVGTINGSAATVDIEIWGLRIS